MNTRYCTDFIEWQNRSTSYINEANYKLLAQKISQAVKFQLPDNGKILEVKSKGTIFETYKDYIPVFKLPYDLLVLELNILDTMNNPAPCILLFEQFEDRIEYFSFIKVEPAGFWVSVTEHAVVIYIDADGVPDRVGFPPVLQQGNKGEEISVHVVNKSIEILFCFLSALCCSNSETTTEIKADEKLNKSRIKKGKAPYFTYKVLTINTAQTTVVTEGSSGSGKHASPRIHLRRGHIRRLPEKTVWVNSCTVGEKMLGGVTKNYKVV